MSAKMKAGTYFVGDPCYAIADELWHEFCNATFKLDDASKEGTPFKFHGHIVWCHGTAFGDGLFRGSDGGRYGVDAGLIGAVPIELADKRSEAELNRLGRIVTFKNDFNVDYDDGLFYIGGIKIDTN